MTNSTAPTRHIDTVADLIDSVLDNPYWTSFDPDDEAATRAELDL